jgi:hypothetical protein
VFLTVQAAQLVLDDDRAVGGQLPGAHPGQGGRAVRGHVHHLRTLQFRDLGVQPGDLAQVINLIGDRPAEGVRVAAGFDEHASFSHDMPRQYAKSMHSSNICSNGHHKG